MKLNRWETNGLRLTCILLWGGILLAATLAPLSLFNGGTGGGEYFATIIILYVIMPSLFWNESASVSYLIVTPAFETASVRFFINVPGSICASSG